MPIWRGGAGCPICKEKSKEYRLHRKIWMRLIPGARLYQCSKCSCEYMEIWRLFSIYISP